MSKQELHELIQEGAERMATRTGVAERLLKSPETATHDEICLLAERMLGMEDYLNRAFRSGQEMEIRDYFANAAQRVLQLEAAIRQHRNEKADDRCWLDDYILYSVLGDTIVHDNRVGDRAEMLLNCKRFIDQRCDGGTWPTYVELEVTITALRADLAKAHEVIQSLASRCAGQSEALSRQAEKA